MPSAIPLCLSVVCGAVSASLWWFVGQRRFLRRNPHGNEVFPTFRAAVGTSLWEWLLTIVSQLSGGFAIGFFLMFLIMRCGGADDPVKHPAPRSSRHSMSQQKQ